MVRSQGKLIILITIAVGILCVRSFQTKETQALKSTEEYWQETGLKASELEELLQPELCHSSERYFLSCANALVTLAERFGLQVIPPAQIKENNNQSLEREGSEKIQLASWLQFYQDQKTPKTQIQFVALFRELLSRIKNRSHEAFYVGMSLNGFLSIFKDPHTYLIPMKFYQEVVSQPDGKTFSLGITLGRSQEGFILRKIQPRSMAEDVGLKRGDRILVVNSKNVESMSLEQVLELLRSESTAEIQILVARNNKKLSFKLKRRVNSNEAIASSLIPGRQKLGLLTINRFTRQSCEISKKSIMSLSKLGARGLLIDLRDNPGGLVEEAACVASLFLGPKKMFTLKYLDTSKKDEIFYGEEDKIFDKPVAVLINSGTASSAELFAGIMKDYNRAVLVGERSFGKGSFQEGEVWFKNPRIALFQTQGLFYLPSRLSPQAAGIEPDVVVQSSSLFHDREEDIFMYPLQADNKNSLLARKKLDLKKCLDNQSNSKQEDPELSWAQLALSCKSLNENFKASLYDSDRSF